jgi:hypothetical protein
MAAGVSAIQTHPEPLTFDSLFLYDCNKRIKLILTFVVLRLGILLVQPVVCCTL